MRSTVHYIVDDDEDDIYDNNDDDVTDTSIHQISCVTAICRGCLRGCVQPTSKSSVWPTCTALIRRLCMVAVSPVLTSTSLSVV